MYKKVLLIANICLLSLLSFGQNEIPETNAPLKFETLSKVDDETKVYTFSFLNPSAEETQVKLDFDQYYHNQITLIEKNSGRNDLVYSSEFCGPITIKLNGLTEPKFELRVRDPRKKFKMAPYVYSVSGFETHTRKINMLSGLFYGALIFIFLYNLILYLNIRTTFLFYYAAYIALFGLFQFAYDGLFMQYGVTDNVLSHVTSIALFTYASYGFNFLFFRDFLNLKERLPLWGKATFVMAVVAFTLSFASIFDFAVFDLFHLLDLMASVFMLCFLSLVIYASIRKMPNSRMVLFSYLWIVSAGMIFIMMFNGVIPDGGMRTYVLKIGLLGELVILTLAASSAIYKNQVQLAHKVVEELENSQRANLALTEAKKEIEKASSIKDRFMVNISHELRTPMNAVLGITSILEGLALPVSVKEPLRNLRLSAAGLLGAVEDILDFKQLTNDSLIVENKSFNLRRSFEYLALTYKIDAENHGLKFVYNFDDTCDGYFIGDQKKINKLVTILLNNALKFTKQGQIGLLVKRVEDLGTHSEFRFEVVDTGVGIAEEHHTKIFESFSQVYSNYDREYGGTGTGLALFNKILNLLGGEYKLDSAEGKGTRFSFEVKVKNSPVSSSNRKNVKSIEEAFMGYKGTFTVLVVEDDPINILIIKKFLGSISSKIKVLLAENGEEAINALLQNKVDMVFMDLQMPTIDGYAATKIIRSDLDESIREVPIVALTAHAMDSERAKCFQYGMNEFIAKPFTKDQLEAVLIKYIAVEDDDLYERQLENLY